MQGDILHVNMGFIGVSGSTYIKQATIPTSIRSYIGMILRYAQRHEVSQDNNQLHNYVIMWICTREGTNNVYYDNKVENSIISISIRFLVVVVTKNLSESLHQSTELQGEQTTISIIISIIQHGCIYGDYYKQFIRPKIRYNTINCTVYVDIVCIYLCYPPRANMA